jgi:hypothetical protein
VDPIGTVFGSAFGALIAFLLPVLGLAMWVFIVFNPRGRIRAILITGLAAASVFLVAPGLQWDPAISTFDGCLLLFFLFPFRNPALDVHCLLGASRLERARE